MDFLNSPIIISLAAGIPVAFVGYLVYGRGRKADKAVEQSGVANLALNALKLLNDNIQEDNKILRKQLARLESCLSDRDKFKQRVKYLEDKYLTKKQSRGSK